jgi:hypothetical protein
VSFYPVEGDIAETATHGDAADVAEDVGDLRGWINNAGVDWTAPAHEATREHIEAGSAGAAGRPDIGSGRGGEANGRAWG